MLPAESLQEIFLFLSRDVLDAVQLVSRVITSVVAKMPLDSPIRHISWLYVKNPDGDVGDVPEGSLQLEFVPGNVDDADELVGHVAASADTSRFVRNACISNVSFGLLVGILLFLKKLWR